MLTCGCPVRTEAPEAMTHNEVAGFENLSVEALSKKIIERYMASAFNNCRNQKLKMMSTQHNKNNSTYVSSVNNAIHIFYLLSLAFCSSIYCCTVVVNID